MSKKFLHFFSKIYDTVKNRFKVSYKASTGEELDEDIFHETILKCYDVEMLDNMEDEAVLNYVYSSFKQNMMREKQYHRVKLSDDYDEDLHSDLVFSDDHSKNIESLHLNELLNKYDPLMVELLQRWLIDNCSIRELEEETGIINLNHKLNKIIKDVRLRFQYT